MPEHGVVEDAGRTAYSVLHTPYGIQEYGAMLDSSPGAIRVVEFPGSLERLVQMHQSERCTWVPSHQSEPRPSQTGAWRSLEGLEMLHSWLLGPQEGILLLYPPYGVPVPPQTGYPKCRRAEKLGTNDRQRFRVDSLRKLVSAPVCHVPWVLVLGLIDLSRLRLTGI